MPEISIVIPVYNVATYLPRCIESILNQTFADFELLLIDDGSSDNSGKICNRYALNDSRVKVYHKPNGGVSSARNLGLENIQGRYVTFVDADDYVSENYLEKLFDAAEKYEADITFCGNVWVEDSFEEFIAIDRYEYAESAYNEMNFDEGIEELTRYNNIFVWGCLISTSLIKNNSLKFKTDVLLGEDTVFVLNVLSVAKTLVFCEGKPYNYIIRASSASHSRFDSSKELKSLQAYLEAVENLCKARDVNRGLKEKLIGRAIVYVKRLKVIFQQTENRAEALDLYKRVNWGILKNQGKFKFGISRACESLLWRGWPLTYLTIYRIFKKKR